MPALRRRAPTVRFISFDTLVTGVRALEWALSVFTSSLVHRLITRRADFAGLTVFALFVAFFATFSIAHVLRLNDPHIVPPCGECKSTGLAASGACGAWCESTRGLTPNQIPTLTAYEDQIQKAEQWFMGTG
jgi:hypothetical protein